MQVPRARSETSVPGLADAPWGPSIRLTLRATRLVSPEEFARSLTRRPWMPEAQRLSTEGQDASIPSGPVQPSASVPGALTAGLSCAASRVPAPAIEAHS